MTRYDRKLARSVYAMVLVAILAMVLAEGTIVYFALACVAALISWPIAHGRTGPSSVPRWLISLAVLIALTFFLVELTSGQRLAIGPLGPLGHFMIFVQVCKFFEDKRARDYGQLIILSMLEMIVSAILSSSMVFVVLLLGYLALGSYSLVLYHFKREMELFEQSGRRRRTLQPASSALTGAAEVLNGIHPWRFWRFSSSAGAVALAIGTLLFVFFPRVGEDWLGGGGLAGAAGGSMTGLSDTTRLGEVGPIQQSDEVAMRVTVLEDGRAINPHGSLLLRCLTADRYDHRTGIWGESADFAERGAWPTIELGPNTATFPLPTWDGGRNPLAERELRISTRSIQAEYLFSPYPPIAVQSASALRVRYNRFNQTIQAAGPTPGGTTRSYSVWVPRDPAAVVDAPAPEFPITGRRDSQRITDLAVEWTAGLSSDQAKVEAIERRLHDSGEYRYTLDLGPTVGDREYPDPLEAFLFKVKAGHCEYFASAMTVLCQRLGIPARLVGGYKALEFNDQGSYYIVRQRHAHSWVEVYLGRTPTAARPTLPPLPRRGGYRDRAPPPVRAAGSAGWVTFDPTPGGAGDNFAPPSGILGWLDHAVDNLNYRFQQRVLGYSQGDREAILAATAAAGKSAMRGLTSQASSAKGLRDWLWPAAPLVGGVIAAIFLLFRLGRLRWPGRSGRRWRILGSRWGGGAAGAAEGGVGFWADLLAILGRARIFPAAALTPREVAMALAGSLGLGNPGGAAQVPGLGELGDRYYAVRYGHRRLSPAEQETIDATIKSLAETLRNRKRANSLDWSVTGPGT